MLNTAILNINPEIVCNIILKAKAIQAKEGVSFNEEMPNTEYEYDANQILADHSDDETFLEIKHIIDELEPDQQLDLLTLMYIGRGDFEQNEWSAARKMARDNLGPNLTGYLLSKPLIAYYLEKGLSYLNYSCEE